MKKYKSVLLKLSGEALGDKKNNALYSPEALDYISEEIKQARLAAPETHFSIVVGGGNIWRGARSTGINIPRSDSDSIGMLATIMNGIALRSALEEKGIASALLTSVNIYPLAEHYSRRKALLCMENGSIAIFAGGTGSPFFTTDTGAALRAAETGAEIIFKATQVNGVYDADPNICPNAKKYDSISYDEALSKGLKIMDASALAMCLDNKISSLVFSLRMPGNIKKAILGEQTGSIIHP